MLDKKEKEKIIETLVRKVPSLECPMCHNRRFILADGYTMLGVQDSKDHWVMGGSMMPVIGLVCSQCGFISFHALGALGLLGKKEEENTDAENNNHQTR